MERRQDNDDKLTVFNSCQFVQSVSDELGFMNHETHETHETHENHSPQKNSKSAIDFSLSTSVRKFGWRVIVVWECQTEKPKRVEQFARRLRLSGASRAGRIF